MTTPTPLWEPGDVSSTEIGRYIAWLRDRGLIENSAPDYHDLWDWSVADPDRFWSSIWQFFDIRADGDPTLVLADPAMPAPAGSPTPGSTTPNTHSRPTGPTTRWR
jgi:acetoacetyl-CoA synthetase